MNDVPVITIDGPSASGKGSVATLVAKELHWYVLDSGAIYRSLAWAILQTESAIIEDADKLSNFLKHIPLTLSNNNVYWNKQNISDEIRDEHVAKMASKISRLPEVRETLLNLQRLQKRPPGLVADGRDMGTTVFPESQYKFYLTASIDTRAKRRLAQLRGQKGISLEKIRQDLVNRDDQDLHRALSPLKIPNDAILIDNENLSISEVAYTITSCLKK